MRDLGVKIVAAILYIITIMGIWAALFFVVFTVAKWVFGL